MFDTNPEIDPIFKITPSPCFFMGGITERHIRKTASKFRSKILDILKSEGYISNYILENSENNKKIIKVNLKYYEGNPVIKEIKRISKPGRRVYSRATSIPKIQNGLGLAIISTSQGVMSDIEARKNNIGGEIICKVF